MFRLLDVRSERYDVSFVGEADSRGNRVELITGPNGSGKTTLLTDLANVFFRPGRSDSSGVRVRWAVGRHASSNHPNGRRTGEPSRVIAQTFSPFSRFPAPADDMLSLTDRYADGREGEETYRVVGIHRRTRFVGGYLARHTLEQGVFRTAESVEHIENMARVLREIGFRDRIVLSYRQQAELREVLDAHDQGKLLAYLDATVKEWEGRRSRVGYGGFASAVAREFRAVRNLQDFAGLVSQALELVQSVRQGSSTYEHEVWLASRKASGDFAVLQSLALLRRLRLLGLQACSLQMIDGPEIDLADSSSGQQQMICSIFGLVAELRSNSLVLIDEPELSLHPTWQSSYLDRINGLLAPFSGCHVLIATHSALLAQRAMSAGLNIVKLGVHSEAELEGEVFDPMPAGAVGDARDRQHVSVEETLVDVFRTPISGSVYLANELFTLVTSAEEPENRHTRQTALRRLNQLRSTFAKDPAMSDDVKLIDKAIELVETSGNEDVPERESDD